MPAPWSAQALRQNQARLQPAKHTNNSGQGDGVSPVGIHLGIIRTCTRLTFLEQDLDLVQEKRILTRNLSGGN